ncbi:MAG: hypothetical protein HEEMFOPI_01237 [Holosporales bacterium]
MLCKFFIFILTFISVVNASTESPEYCSPSNESVTCYQHDPHFLSLFFPPLPPLPRLELNASFGRKESVNANESENSACSANLSNEIPEYPVREILDTPICCSDLYGIPQTDSLPTYEQTSSIMRFLELRQISFELIMRREHAFLLRQRELLLPFL